MTDVIRLVIADDHAIVREGLRAVLDGHEDMLVVAEAKNGAEAMALVTTLTPDVAVLDVSMPDQSGLDVARAIRAEHPGTRVLMLSVYDDAEYVRKAVQVGAAGYVLKDSPPAELREAIRTVHRGGTVFAPHVVEQLSKALAEDTRREDDQRVLDRLTPRERDVLTLIASGLTNKAAAAQLGISARTVETHRENLLRKLGVRSVAEVTKLAIRTGLIRS